MKALKITISVVGIILLLGTVIRLSAAEPTHGSMYILSMFLGMAIVLFLLLFANSMAEYTNPKTPGLPKFENPMPPPPIKEELPIIKIRVERKISDLQFPYEHMIMAKMNMELMDILHRNNLIHLTKNVDDNSNSIYVLYELNVIPPKKIFTYKRNENSVSKLGESPYPKDPNSYRDEMTNQYRKEE